AHDREAAVGAVRERRPHLLAVDDPLVAVEHRARLHVRQVGAGVRLRVALAPELVGGLDLRQEPALLLLGAVREQRRREQALAEEAHAGGRVGLGVLLAEDDLLGEARVPTAVLLGPVEPDPAVASEQLLPLDAQLPRGLVRRPAAAAELGELTDEVVGQPRAPLVAKCGLRGRVEEIHDYQALPGELFRTIRTVLDRSVKLPGAGTLTFVPRPPHYEDTDARIDKLTVGPFRSE